MEGNSEAAGSVWVEARRVESGEHREVEAGGQSQVPRAQNRTRGSITEAPVISRKHHHHGELVPHDLPVSVCTNPLNPPNRWRDEPVPNPVPPPPPPLPPFLACPNGDCALAPVPNGSWASKPIFISLFALARSRSCSLILRCGMMSGEAWRGGAVDTRESGTPNELPLACG